MKQLTQPSDLCNSNREVCLAIGMFDGVHLGHQQVLKQTVLDASQNKSLPVAVTFDQHPANIISPEKAPALIQSQAQRIRTIESLGIEATLVIKFNKEFSLKKGEIFIKELAEGFGSIHSVCVGNNFMFGHNRDGDIALLEELGKSMGFLAHGIQAVSLNEQIISSTRIRNSLRKGSLHDVNKMLGRKFSIEGTIIRGDGKGRKIGYPTANLDTTGIVLPPNGVYSANANLNEKIYRSVLNIGIRPTIIRPEPSIQVEAHLLDFNENIYGKIIEIEFVDQLRDEIAFASTEELKKQISRDINKAQTLF